MKKITLKLIIILVQLFVLNAYAQNEYSNTISNRIREEGFVTINGIEQWVTISGDRTKPVILFLSGGPGSPLSPYADAVYSKWEKDFILVQWDQREPEKPLGLQRRQS